MEAEYAYDETSALSLYDCLVPKIKSRRRIICKQDYKMTVQDIVEKQKANQMEWDLFIKKNDFQKLKDENEMLKYKNKQMETKQKILDLYKELMENGIDTEELLR